MTAIETLQKAIEDVRKRQMEAMSAGGVDIEKYTELNAHWQQLEGVRQAVEVLQMGIEDLVQTGVRGLGVGPLVEVLVNTQSNAIRRIL